MSLHTKILAIYAVAITLLCGFLYFETLPRLEAENFALRMDRIAFASELNTRDNGYVMSQLREQGITPVGASNIALKPTTPAPQPGTCRINSTGASFQFEWKASGASWIPDIPADKAEKLRNTNFICGPKPRI